MNYKEVHKPEMKIVGISLKTTNENGKSSIDQPAFWHYFINNNIQEKIPNKVNPTNIMGVYTDYVGDYTKPFTFIIGFEVSCFATVPKGMVSVNIMAGRYALFTGKGKDNVEKVTNTWEKIWQSDIKRCYKTDFEVYDLTDKKADVEIYIGFD
ncbi:MAG: AraC family transcriptional regulator [Spirochaetales bacterium]|nr:AraC family transcriptional regulator [Spirochaetales bacterium]